MQNNDSNIDEKQKTKQDSTLKRKTPFYIYLRWIMRVAFALIVLFQIVYKFKHPEDAKILGLIGVGIYALLFIYSIVKSLRIDLKKFQFVLIRNSIFVGMFFAAWRWIFGYKCIATIIGASVFDFALTIFLLASILASVLVSIIEFARRSERSLMDLYVLVLIISGLCAISLFPFIIENAKYMPSGLMGNVLHYSALGFGGLFVLTVALTIPLIAFLYLRRKFTSVISLKFVVKRKLSYLAMATVALGVFVLIIVTGVMGGFKAELRKRIRGSQSHLLVPLSIPGAAIVKNKYDLPPFEEDFTKPDSTIYSMLLGVEYQGSYERFRKSVADEFELEYKTLEEYYETLHIDFDETNDPLMFEAIRKKLGLTPNVSNFKALEIALRKTLNFDESMDTTVMMLRARAIKLGFTKEDDLRFLRSSKDLVALCRTNQINDMVNKYREMILKLNDPAYRAELLKYIDSKGEVQDTEISSFFTSQNQVYSDAKKILQQASDNEKIIEGASGRLRTMALVIKEQNREIDYCQIMAIDPSNDLLISDLGLYLQQALYYELNQRLSRNLNNTAMYIARKFSLTSRTLISPRSVRSTDLKPVGWELFNEIMLTASLITKSPQEDNDPNFPLKQELLLSDLRDSLTMIINRHRDSIVSEYMTQGLTFDEARKQAIADNEKTDYVLINEIRGIVITGFEAFKSALSGLISGSYPRNICIESKMKLKGFDIKACVTPKALHDELIKIIKAGNEFLKQQKNYAEKMVIFAQIKDKLVKAMTDYLDKTWETDKIAMLTGGEGVLEKYFPELKGITGKFTVENTDLIEEHLENLKLLFESLSIRISISDDQTFWDFEGYGAISLDKILDADFPKVREQLRNMSDGLSPFKDVVLAWDGKVRVKSSKNDKLKKNDAIVGINDLEVNDFEDMREILSKLKMNSKLMVEIERGNHSNIQRSEVELEFNQEFIIGVKQLIPFYRFEEDAERSYRNALAATQLRNSDEVALPIPPVIIGDRMAQNYGSMGQALAPGIQSRLHLATAITVNDDGTLDQSYEARERSFHVSALFHSMFYEDDRRRVYMPLKHALLFLDGAQVEIFVGVKLTGDKYTKSDEYSNLIFAALDHHMNMGEIGPRYNIVRSWEQEKATLIQAVDREEALLSVVLSFIIIYAGLMIVIIIYLMVKEKTKDIGILKALGGSPDGIQSIFLFNGFFIGFFGAIFGLIAGLFVVYKSNWLEDVIERIWGVRIFPAEVYYLTYIPTKTDPTTWILITIPTIILSFLFALYPAYKAAKMDPVQALQYE